MAEWLKAHAWKACLGETLTWVRIPLSPPESCFGSISLGLHEGTRGNRSSIATRPFGKNKADHFAVCLPKIFCDCLRIHVHRCSDVRVSQQFLLHLQVDSKLPKHA